ncbi:MAG: hypothetical protein LBB56_01715 [Chitinispirillales bacterium]|jgi:anti-anti-sigma regulatory factor|nr:hypothetical protein [Chitinispirillales bacterium]
MSFRKFDHENFLFIKYKKETVSDLEKLRKELMEESGGGRGSRDTVLDCSLVMVISSMEIGIIIQFLKTLPGSGRFLRLVTSSYVRELLIAMNLHKISNLIIYDNIKPVMEYFSCTDDSLMASA